MGYYDWAAVPDGYLNDLLHSGVDTKTLRVWLGHVSLQTTQIYAESDLKMKAKALATSLCSIIQ